MEEKENVLEAAWKEYSETLLSYIRHKVASQEDAEDILADIFLKLAQQADLFKIPYKLPHWLYRVSRNSIIDYYRTRKLPESLPEELTQEQPDSLILARLSKCIIPLIQQLPETYRQSIFLSEIEGKKQKEVAQELRITLAAVKSRILRGRQKLKDIMAKRCTFIRNERGELIDYLEKSKK